MAHHAPPQRLHTARGTEPAQDRLVPDPHRHDVVAGDAAVLAPVHRGVPGREAAVADARVDRDEIADVALAHHLDDGAVERQGHRRGHDLGDLSGMAARDVEHRLRLDRVHRHAGLAEHVLARLQRRYRERGVHVGPGPDAHRVDILVVDDRRPVVVYPRDAEGFRHPAPGSERAVGDRDHVHSLQGLESGNVATGGVRAGADQGDSDVLFAHASRCFLAAEEISIFACPSRRHTRRSRVMV